MIFTTRYESPVGSLLLAERESALIGLWTATQNCDALLRTDDVSMQETPVLIEVKQWLDCYFSGKKPEISELPLNPYGSKFQQAVWRILRELPYGETVTYGEIAVKMATLTGKQKMSAQAVGGAVGHNPISIIVPCHRVVGANGNLTGYAGGLAVKIQLLTHEGVDMTKFLAPEKGTAL